jgi:hypothetical protein
MATAHFAYPARGANKITKDQKLSLSANWIWRMALEVEVM